MGTPCELHFYPPAGARPEEQAMLLVDEARRLECKYSRYREDSLLSTINRSAGTGEQLALDPETAGLLDYADTCFRESNGLFDITSGVLRECWNFRDYSHAPVLPSPAQLGKVLQRCGWQKLQWQSPHLALPLPGMQLDLGGVVKEYAADRLAVLATELGISHGLVEMGGDIRLIGPHASGEPWQLGIRNPADPDKALLALPLRQGAMATSGTYERFLTLNGRRYHHILNPLTGWPVSGLQSVSVIASHCMVAGSAATIAILREADGPAWLDSLGLPWLGVEQDGRLSGPLAKLAVQGT